MYLLGDGVIQDFVQAHMWVNLAVSKLSPGTDYDRAVEARALITGQMTSIQIAEAQRLAREWKPMKEGK